VRRGPRARAATLAGVLALSLVVAGCGSDGGDEPAAAPGGDAMTLTIKDFAYSPQPLEVAKGTVVKVVNEDDAAHTVTADDKSFDTGDLGASDSKELTLSEEGEFAFHCDIHDYMKGVIRVTA
jgi:plastocyanin